MFPIYDESDADFWRDESYGEWQDARARRAEKTGGYCQMCGGFPCVCARCSECGNKGFLCSCPPVEYGKCSGCGCEEYRCQCPCAEDFKVWEREWRQ